MELPLILSGPIVRRVDRSSIYIWIATSQSCEVKAKLYVLSQQKNDIFHSKWIADSSNSNSIRFGENLFVHLIEIIPQTRAFPTDTLLGYNLFFQTEQNTLDLQSFDLLSQQNPHSLVYGNLPYPSFFIQEKTQTNLLYGSCRKLHGKGDDALACGDILIEESYNNLVQRPNALFLMGDQIYADDVADPIMPCITQLSTILMGRHNEELSRIDRRLKLEPFRTCINQIHGRKFIMEQFCQFTSGQAHNHIIRFGEFAIMYLLSWAPQLWDVADEMDLIGSFRNALEKDFIHFIYPKNHSTHDTELLQHEIRYMEQEEDLHRFRQTLPQIRRLLANIPTYMIFDDHDLTDDWNLSAGWKKNVSNSALGRHVIANGLAAYWTFQGWGNHPEQFDDNFMQTMADYFKALDVSSEHYLHWTKLLWKYDQWTFVAPTGPKALFLDTRTMRSFDPTPEPTHIGMIIEENIRSPKLISSNGWKKTHHCLQESGWKSGDPLIVISATPLYGIGLIESFLYDYIYPFTALGLPVNSTLDFEAWKYNGEGFNEFLYWISKWKPSHCIILSGDVHYASSVKTIIETPLEDKQTILQFTSSPLNNMSFYGIWGFLMKSVIWFNSIKRKKEAIHRYCDTDYNIIHTDKKSACPKTSIWTEIIRYLSTNKGAIIETNNNMGLLSLSSKHIKNTLLSYNGIQKQETSFQTIHLEN